jgi:transcriptional regulator with XRE-family HTH domain
MPGVQESSRNLQRLRFPMAAVPPDVGVRVAAARRRRRWSQARLAARAGISRASVYRLEGGAAAGTADTLFRIAHALDLPIKDLVPEWPEWEPVKSLGPGEAARERRRALGLTLAEVAQEIGVSEASLSRYERGIGESPAFLRRVGDDVVPCNDLLQQALGLATGE